MWLLVEDHEWNTSKDQIAAAEVESSIWSILYRLVSIILTFRCRSRSPEEGSEFLCDAVLLLLSLRTAVPHSNNVTSTDI